MSPRRFARVLVEGASSFAELVDSDALLLDGAPWAGGARTGHAVPVAGARLLAPVAPSKILCVGRNYREHAKELGNEVPAEPLLFFKPPSALLDPGGTIELPAVSERVDHEAEVGVVVGRRLRRATVAEARSSLFGFTLVGDITARDLQKKDGQWTRAKGMDTFCPVGPWLVTGLDPEAITFECRVNGDVRQRGSTADMVVPIAELIAYASRFMTLEAGDLVVTGTPSGVGPLHDGDVLELGGPELGTLRLDVRAAQ